MMEWIAIAKMLKQAIRRVPPAVYVLLAGVLIVAGAARSIANYGQSRFEEGKRVAKQSAAFDSTLVAMLTANRKNATAKTDTIVRYIKAAKGEVQKAVEAMPDTIKALPEVAPLVVACNSLEVATDSLVMQIDVERAAHQMERSVLIAENTALRITTNQMRDSVEVLKKRPTRGTMAKVGAVALGVGLIAKPVTQWLVRSIK